MSSNIGIDTLDQKGKHELHAVIVPFPAQSHVNVLMNLAQLLAIRGVFVTFVNTEWIYKRIVEASKDGKSLVSEDDPELEQQGRKIRFLSIPDGLPPHHGRTSNLAELVVALQKLGPSLEDFLSTAGEKSPSFPPITFIVTDAFMSCTEEVATNLKVPRVIFWPLCAAASVSQCYANLLVSEGFIPVNGLPRFTLLYIVVPGNVFDIMDLGRNLYTEVHRQAEESLYELTGGYTSRGFFPSIHCLYDMIHVSLARFMRCLGSGLLKTSIYDYSGC